MLRYNEFYDVRTFWRSLVALVAMMTLMYLTKGSGFVIAVPFVLSALFKRDPLRLFFWLLLTIAMVVGNSTLMPKNMFFVITQRGLLVFLSFMMIVQIAGTRSSATVKCIVPFIVYVAYMIFPSSVGWNPIISFLKIVLFFSVFLAFLGSANGIANSKVGSIQRLRGVILSFIAFFVVGSLFLIPFPGISQMALSEFAGQLYYDPESTSLFKGMTMHSQSLGPCLAGAGVFLFTDFIFSVRKFDRLYALLLGTIPFLLYKTSSRTAMGAFVAGCAVACLIFMNAKGINLRWKGKVMNVIFAAVIAFSIAAVAIPSIHSSVIKFATKGLSTRDASIDKIVLTRVGKYEESMDGFRQSPFIGNGFQVNALMKDKKGTSIKEYLSAPVEKGFWWAAVLEEGGVAGMIIFLCSLLSIFAGSMRNKAYVGLATFMTLFICNFGEFMMFSMSYTGGFLWAMVFCGYALDALRNSKHLSMY